ncbi:hypothetical protein SDAV_00674 [Spiroplasma phoeniceum P40]|uniref:Uncharacterized protein n=1 Tax=Spiroplasma phoeniceum P40 TaxID=1276259 RepID=A0A345DN75_9MOLU|nr:hypothetical protein SDAV_00674 [Spiroplasma phoeniceum P40]
MIFTINKIVFYKLWKNLLRIKKQKGNNAIKKIFSLLAPMSFVFGTMSKIIATSSLVDQQREPLIIEEQSNLDLYYKNNDNKCDIVFNDWGFKKRWMTIVTYI